MIDFDWNLLQKAIKGDAMAAKIYCGSYDLVRCKLDGKLFRTKFSHDLTRFEIVKNAKDEDGFLLPQYWGLPIL